MLLTFLILFRESLEAFLLVGILLAYLRRIGGERYARWIYVGVAAGLTASVVAAFVLQVVVDQFSNELYRAVFTAAIMLVATGILTYMAIWMHRQARAHTEHAKRQLEEYMTAGNVIGINGQEIVRGLGNYEFPEFSPDSKRFATMIWTGKNYALSVDGKTGPVYEDFLEVNPNVARFLDSHTFRFLGVKNGSVYRVTVDLGG